MQQKREPRNKPTHLWSLLFDKGGKNIQWKKRQSLQQVVLGKLDSWMYTNAVRTFPYTNHKNKVKMA